MLTTIGEFIGQNWLSTTVSIIAIVYAVYEARRRRGPKLVYQFTGQRLIGTGSGRFPSGVEITFEGTKLANLTQSQIVVWNKGDAPLRSDDVPAHDPITFSFGDGARVFIAEVARVTREVNNCEIAYEGGVSNGVIFKFEFLDRGDGALLRVWHDARDSVPDVSGTLLGQKEGVLSYGRFTDDRRNISPPRKFSGALERAAFQVARLTLRKGFSKFGPFLMVAAGAYLALSPFAYLIGWGHNSRSQLATAVDIGFGIFYALMGLAFYNMARRRFPKTLIPEEFRPTKTETNEGDDSSS